MTDGRRAMRGVLMTGVLVGPDRALTPARTRASVDPCPVARLLPGPSR